MNRTRGTWCLAAAGIAGLVAFIFWAQESDATKKDRAVAQLVGRTAESTNYAPAILLGIAAAVLVICAAIFLSQSRGTESSE